jgi:hypothetical protein
MFLSLSVCGYVRSNPLVCCSQDSVYPRMAIMKPQEITLEPAPKAANSLPDPSECAAALEERIYGGVEAKVDEFPFSALLLYTKCNQTFGFLCAKIELIANEIFSQQHGVRIQLRRQLDIAPICCHRSVHLSLIMIIVIIIIFFSHFSRSLHLAANSRATTMGTERGSPGRIQPHDAPRLR